jgi:uncharacterized protein
MAGFLPECLTISLGSECNLDCIYCYKYKSNSINKGSGAKINTDGKHLIRAVSAAAEIVIDSCRKSGKNFYFGFQGEGEPFTQFETLKKVCSRIEEISAASNIGRFSFITTNGTSREEDYIWASKHFNRICLSIDGPPDIHNLHRPFKDGQPSFGTVKNTLDILQHYATGSIVCRTTITRHNANMQESVLRYLVKDLGIKEVQFEPVYDFSQESDLYPSPAIFAVHFAEALKEARSLGAKLVYSGLGNKKNSLPYCNINKKVLFITPSGKATACMFRENESEASIYTIGYYDDNEDKFILDEKKIQEFIKYLNGARSICGGCNISQYCTFGCPDFCLIDSQIRADKNKNVENSLRCRINRIVCKEFIN